MYDDESDDDSDSDNDDVDDDVDDLHHSYIYKTMCAPSMVLRWTRNGNSYTTEEKNGVCIFFRWVILPHSLWSLLLIITVIGYHDLN